MRPDAPSRRYAQPVLGHERLAPGHPRNGFGRIGERHDQLAGKRQRGGGRPTIVEMSASMSENSTFSRRECSDRDGLTMMAGRLSFAIIASTSRSAATLLRL